MSNQLKNGDIYKIDGKLYLVSTGGGKLVFEDKYGNMRYGTQSGKNVTLGEYLPNQRLQFNSIIKSQLEKQYEEEEEEEKIIPKINQSVIKAGKRYTVVERTFHTHGGSRKENVWQDKDGNQFKIIPADNLKDTVGELVHEVKKAPTKTEKVSFIKTEVSKVHEQLKNIILYMESEKIASNSVPELEQIRDLLLNLE